MIHVEFAMPVAASRKNAWEMLRERADAPERFIPQVAASEVLERSEGEVLRRVTFADGITITERVRFIPEEELIYHFISHPKFEGEIRNLIFEADDLQFTSTESKEPRMNAPLWLSIYFRGKTREGVVLDRDDLDQLREGLARSVLAAVREIEERERSALEPT